MTRRVTVELTEKEARTVLGALDHADCYYNDLVLDAGRLTRDEAIAKAALDRASDKLREALR